MVSSARQSQLALSERMAATMKIMSVCKSRFPELDMSEIQSMAKTAEEEAFTKAQSREDYQQLWQDTLKTLSLPVQGSELLSTIDSTASLDSIGAPVQDVVGYKAQYYASGITSTVYRSISSRDKRIIAIKLTTPSRIEQPHDTYREARLLKKAAHSSVIELISTKSAAGGHYLLIFPFMPHDFGTMIDQKALTEAQTRSHLHSLFSAVEHIHSLDIIHRDIKPSNLLLASPSGPAYLADFGIAWHDEDVNSESKGDKITDVGTTCYRAPELMFGNRRYGKGIDLWAAGCVVAEALKGGALFDAGDLGSELALLRSIFQTLGTPSDDTWPEARTFPDWGKMQFTIYSPKDWEHLLPGVKQEGRYLVSSLVRYQSTERTGAAEALKHPFFTGLKVIP